MKLRIFFFNYLLIYTGWNMYLCNYVRHILLENATLFVLYVTDKL